MPSKQEINILGHIGRDAEFKDVASGLTTFSVAVTEGRKNKDTNEWTNITTWYTVNCWGEYGKKFVGKLLKGHLVDVTGKPSVDVWSKDGEAKAKLVVTADSRNILGLTKVDAPAAKVQDESLPF